MVRVARENSSDKYSYNVITMFEKYLDRYIIERVWRDMGQMQAN